MVISTKSSDQDIFQRGDQATRKRVRLSKTNICKVFCWNIKRSRTIFEWNQAIKVKFCQSKILIPVANGSTGTMNVTTPCFSKKIFGHGAMTLGTAYLIS